MSSLLESLKGHLDDDIVINIISKSNEHMFCLDFTNDRTEKTFAVYGDVNTSTVRLSSLLESLEKISNDKTIDEIANEAMEVMKEDGK